MEFKEIIKQHQFKYPLMQPIDYVKLAYQNEFGPKHLGLKFETAYAWIQKEWENAVIPDFASAAEDIGNNLCRCYLWKDADEDEKELFTKLFLLTGEVHKGSIPGLLHHLETLREFNIPGMENWLDEYTTMDYPAVSHSDTYREAYSPHYRLIRKDYLLFFPLILKLWKAYKEKGQLILSIDGTCGSGKTTLAYLLQKLFDGTVFHMDDFYLPVEKRAADWKEIPGGNMDLERFEQEVLIPLQKKAPVIYRPYDCQKQDYSDARTIPNASFIIIEGSYSQHPRLASYYDLKIFLTCRPHIQKERLMKREGSYYPMFESCWIPLEQKYHEAFQIKANADLHFYTCSGTLIEKNERTKKGHPPIRQAKETRKKQLILSTLILSVLVMTFACLFAGSSGMTFSDCIAALMRTGSDTQIRIIWNIRLPRVLAAILAGGGLSAAGLIMQTTLNNSMASPSTLGVSNAAVFGANLSIIAFAGGYLSTGNNLSNYSAGANPYATSAMAFAFAVLSVLLILALCKVKSFSPNVVVLAGIALGNVWTAATTILQFYATDVGLSAAVIWSFGDLGRADYKDNLILFLVISVSVLYFVRMSWKYNALLSGEATALTMGVHVEQLRFFSLLFASVITAVCVSFLGIIGFVGIICPHITKKILGEDHRITIPVSILSGSLLLLAADTFARCIGNGSVLPVGAITTLLGAPFFIAIIFSGRRNTSC